MALIDEVAKMAQIDQTKHQSYLDIMVPALLEKASAYCQNEFDSQEPPASVKIFIAESIQHNLNSHNLSSRSMGSVSYSYDTDMPEKIKEHLKPYRRLRF